MSAVRERRLMTAPLLQNEKLVEGAQITTTLSGESMEGPESKECFGLLFCNVFNSL